MIISIDPGTHTGVAIKYSHGGYDTLMFESEISVLWDIILTQKPSVLIVERYQPYGPQRIDANGLATIEVCGSIYALAHVVGAELIIQEAIQRLPFMHDARERLPQLTKAKIDSHQIDAMAHLIRYEKVGNKGNKYPPQLGLRSVSANSVPIQ